MQDTNTTRKRRVGKIALVAALPVALFSGCVGGIAISDGDGTDATAAEPQPTATVTATPEPAPTVTETAEPEVETVTEEVEVEVEVEVASQSCLDALDAGDRSIELLRQGLDYSADAMGASARMDIAGIDQATAGIEALTPDLEDAGFDWGFWSEACRDGS